MPEVVQKTGEDNTQQPNTPEVKTETVDAFGNNLNPEKVEAPTKEAPTESGKDIETHPVVVQLKKEIEDVKKNYGSNLSGQRKKIESLESELQKYRDGKPLDTDKSIEENVPFKEIKWSKDLTKEQREEMTDVEIRQMDQIAEMQKRENDRYIESTKAQKSNETKQAEDRQSIIKETAKALATDATGELNEERANLIIESVKQFNLDGLTEEQIKERVKSAEKLIPTYTPPKETTIKDGKVVTTENPTDPFNTDSIIKEAMSENDGNYSL